MNPDVIIIGGSFAGLSAAMQLGRVRRNTLIVDASQPRNRFATVSHGFPGQDGRSPAEIKRLAEAEVLAYPTVAIKKDWAEAVMPVEDGFKVRLASGETLFARKVLLAMGVKDELPAIPGLIERWGKSVVNCPYCHGYEYRDGRLGMLATVPRSAMVALLLSDLGPTTYFCQESAFEPDANMLALFEKRGVTVERSPIVEALGQSDQLETVRLADGRIIPLDILFIGARTSLVSDLPAQLGCALEEGILGPYLRVDHFQQTTVPGIFAAGDAASLHYNGTLAAASGVMAGVCLHQMLVADEVGMKL